MNKLSLLGFGSKSRLFSVNTDKCLSLLQPMAKRCLAASALTPKMKEKEIKVLHSVLPEILNKIVTSPKISKVPKVAQWINMLLEHNTRGGKLSRGLMTMFVFEMLEKPENITEENLKLSKVLGWCAEMVQGIFVIVDDIMDASQTRRGVPCWYLMPNVGLGAINDSVLIHTCIIEALEKYFLNKPYYNDLVRIINETILFSSMGQHIDFVTANHKDDHSLFTIERYNSMSKYKTGYYSFRLPILLGLSLVKDVDTNILPDIDYVSFKLGVLYQLQNDYLDCYGDVAVSGKIGTDIQEGKCTWFAINALKLCNKEQKGRFVKHYGSKELEDVAIIKNLYNELGIPDLYKQTESKLYDDIVTRFNALPFEAAPDLFYKMKAIFNL